MEGIPEEEVLIEDPSSALPPPPVDGLAPATPLPSGSTPTPVAPPAFPSPYPPMMPYVISTSLFPNPFLSFHM
jgi:hypothetical protein